MIGKTPSFGRPRLGAYRPFPFNPAAAGRLTWNGRTAIREGLRAIGLPAGGRVLVPAWHCGSEVDAILAAGGRPVPYRLDSNLSADPAHLAALLAADGAFAIYAIHYFGHPQPVETLQHLARDHGAVLIEDLALGLYSTDAGGTPLGQAGAMSVFSLVKTLPVPDGGALWLRDPAARAALPDFVPPPMRRTAAGLASLVRRGRRRKSLVDRFADTDPAALDAWDPSAGIAPGVPPRRASVATALLLRLTDHAGVAAAHRRAWHALEAVVPATPAIHPLMPTLPPGACPAYFPLFAADPTAATAALAAAGVESVRFWRRFHPDIDLAPFPEIVAVKRHVLRLPVHPAVDAEAVRRIAAALAPLA